MKLGRILAAAMVLISISITCIRQADAANEVAMCDAAKRMAGDQQRFFDEAKGEKLGAGKWKAKGQTANCLIADQGDGGDKSFTCFFTQVGHKGSLEFIAGFEKALGSCLRDAGYLKKPVKISEEDGGTTFGNSWKKHGSDGAEYALESLATEAGEKYGSVIRFSYQPDP